MTGSSVKRVKKSFLIGVLLSLLGAVFFAPKTSSLVAFANSAAPYAEGVTEYGVVILDEPPVAVKKEVLTFYVPKLYVYREEEADCYLTAEYTFYNPTDMEINARAVFPLGDARHGDEDEKTGYGVKINDQNAAIRYRCSYGYSGNNFDYESDVKKLSDTPLEDDFFSPETAVFKYEIRINSDELVYFGIRLANVNDEKRKIMFESSGYEYLGDETEMGTWARKEETHYLYYFGQKPSSAPDIRVYDNAGRRKRVDCDLTVTLVEETTLGSLVEKNFADDRFSLVDRYNAAVAATKDSYDIYGCERYGIYPRDFIEMAKRYLLTWYEYDISFPAKTEVKNTVTAPLRAGSNYRYAPSVYDYTYLWSPAKSWASFSDLTVNIVTPYYLIEDPTNLTFTKTEKGYAAHLDALPKADELRFYLCEDPNPQKIGWGMSGAGAVVLLIAGIACGVFAAGYLIAFVVTVIVSVKKSSDRAKKRKQNQGVDNNQ